MFWGLGLSLLLLRFAPQTVSGACFALLGGELLSSCAADAALYALYRQSWRGVRQTDAPGMARRVGALAAPLALNDLLRAALRALEQFLIPWGLTRAGATRLGAMAAYGTVMGMVFPALMLPSAFLYALVDLLIPELAACRAQGRRERLASVTGQCLRAGLLFAGSRQDCCSRWLSRLPRFYTRANRLVSFCACSRRWRWSCTWMR